MKLIPFAYDIPIIVLSSYAGMNRTNERPKKSLATTNGSNFSSVLLPSLLPVKLKAAVILKSPKKAAMTNLLLRRKLATKPMEQNQCMLCLAQRPTKRVERGHPLNHESSKL